LTWSEKLEGTPRALSAVHLRTLIGFLFGDRLFHWRLRQLAALQSKTAQILKLRGVEEPGQNPTVEIPLLEAAIDENREELIDVWAKLWAAAMDPSRKAMVRRSLIDAVKKMEPIDAVIFEVLAKANPDEAADYWKLVRSKHVSYTEDEVTVSIFALDDLGIFTPRLGKPQVTPLGKMLAKAIL
jgi:hypothetical protein